MSASDQYIRTILQGLDDPRSKKIIVFHGLHQERALEAKGSQTKHQAWPGGYLDHVAECFRIAQAMYPSLGTIRALPFKLSSALIVLYFHDVEKLFKYSPPPFVIDKDRFLFEELSDRHGVTFTEDEKNGLRYVHAEPDAEYSPTTRLMGALASFCHAVDNISARIWFDCGREARP